MGIGTRVGKGCTPGQGVRGVGWGVSSIRSGAAYASLGVGNVTILWNIAGMFAGAYLQGVWRAQRDQNDDLAVAVSH